MTYKGWTIRITPTEITATKGDEELTIRTRNLELVKRAIKRRNETKQ